MNARDKTPLRAQIADRLAAGEDTAAGIAKAIGKGDTPSIVVKELNAMRTDGQVECEQRKKEMLYWLAVPLAQIAGGTHEAPAAPASDLPPGVREGTRAAQICRVLPKFGAAPMTAREIATATGCAKGLIAPVLTAMVKASQVTRIPAGVEGGGYTRLPPAGSDSEGGETDVIAVARQSGGIPLDESKQELATREIPPPQYDPNEVAFTAPTDPAERPVVVRARLADAEQRAALATEMLAERGRTIEALHDMIRTASETLAPHVPGNLDTSDMDLQEIADRVVAGVADLAARLENKDDELLKQAAVIVDLRNQLESLQREAMHAATHLPRQDGYTPAAYLVRAPKRRLRAYRNADSAQAAALAAARNGSGRGEVFALVPVGKAVRGVEWRPA
ncbi:hypothetical protein [Thauera sp.]|uniref:hypothetical protein n=1 Tax=Thauera sp. TaxID=1905334 RepID=UPI002631C528|nr:hypothetical protein [Thauera sp.]